MKALFGILFFLCSTHFAYTQTVSLLLYDKQNESVSDVEIWKNDSIAYTSYIEGKYLLSVKFRDNITIKHDWYEDVTFQILENIHSNDTIFKTLFLVPKAKNINEVIVTHTKYNLLSDVENEFIIDYYPLPSGNVLLLARTGKKHYLKILKDGQEKFNEIQLVHKPERLFLDPFGNFHILTKDSTCQIWLTDNEFKLMKTYPYSEFQKNILNMIAVDSNNVFYKNITKHNQLFVIDVFNKANGQKIVYNSFDEIGFKNASGYYNEIIATYYATVPENENLIELNVWGGELIELAQNWKMIQLIGWFTKIISRPINVCAFGMLDNLLVLDGFKKELLLINYNDFSIKSVIPTFDFSGHFYHDYFFDEVYTYTKKGSITVNKIDINTGKLTDAIELSDILLPRNIKVSNGWVYFLVLDESGYNKLLKTR